MERKCDRANEAKKGEVDNKRLSDGAKMRKKREYKWKR